MKSTWIQYLVLFSVIFQQIQLSMFGDDSTNFCKSSQKFDDVKLCSGWSTSTLSGPEEFWVVALTLIKQVFTLDVFSFSLSSVQSDSPCCWKTPPIL